MKKGCHRRNHRSAGPVRAMSALAVPVTSHDHITGSPDAPLTLVQYGDYQCINCVYAEPAIKALLERHGRHLRFVFRHFAGHSTHHQTPLTALAAEAAGAQGKFWEMHDLLFTVAIEED